MPKKRTRYSPSLAADLVVPIMSVEEGLDAVAAPTEKMEFPAASETPSNDSNSYQIQERPFKRETKKWSRYKKMLPSDWVDADSDPDPNDANPHLQDPHSEAPDNNVALHDHESHGLRSDPSDLERSTRPARHVDTSIPRQGNSGYTPAPPLTGTKSHHWEGEERRQTVPYHETLANQMTRNRVIDGSLARHSDEIARSQSFRGATVSPPVSVGQESSAMTDNPFYGQDLPAKGPCLSPSYSIV